MAYALSDEGNGGYEADSKRRGIVRAVSFLIYKITKRQCVSL